MKNVYYLQGTPKPDVRKKIDSDTGEEVEVERAVAVDAQTMVFAELLREIRLWQKR